MDFAEGRIKIDMMHNYVSRFVLRYSTSRLIFRPFRTFYPLFPILSLFETSYTRCTTEDDDFYKATSLLPANMCVYRKIYIWSDRPHYDVIMLQGRGKKILEGSRQKRLGKLTIVFS